MRILVIAPAWVGDIVMSQSLLKSIKQKYGFNTHIDLLINPIFKPLALRMPEVDCVINNPFAHGSLQLFKRIKLGLSLRKNKYDQIYVLPNSLKSAIVPFFAGKVRIGFTGEARYGLINQRYDLDKAKLPLMVQRFCALTNDGNLPKTIDYPKLSADLANQNYLITKLELNPRLPIIGFCPGAEYGISKRWDPTYFAKLADLLNDAKPCQIILLGNAKDQAVTQLIEKHSKQKLINLCGKTSLGDAVDLLSLCSHVVSNDSGLMHIAASLNTNLIALFGSTSPNFTPPLSDHAHILKANLACSPCFKRECQYGHYNCQNLITPHMLLKHIKV